MSDELFRAGEGLTATKLNRVVRQVGAEAGEDAADGAFGRHYGRPLDTYGSVDRTGSQTMAALINTAIAACAADGVPLLLGPGRYLASVPIVLPSNVWVVCAPGAVIVRNCTTVGVTGLIQQTSYASAISNVRWTGGTIENPDPDTLTGRAFGLYMNDSVIEDVFIDEWADTGTAMFVMGSRNRISRIHAVSLNDGGGIVIQGGSDNRVSDCWVECGDDCFQIGSTGTVGSPPYGIDVKRNQYVNCTGYSRNARVMICGVGSGSAVATSTDVDIVDNAFIGIQGRGRLAITLLNNESTGVVARTRFIGCQVDCSEAAVGGAGAVDMLVGNSSGGLTDTLFDGCAFLGGVAQTVDITGGVKRTRFVGCYIGPPNSADEVIIVDDGCDARFIGCTIHARSDNTAAVIGGSGANTARAYFKDCVFIDIGDTRFGVNFRSCAAGSVDGCRFESASGATSSRAIGVTDGCLNVVVGDNDYTNLVVAERVYWPNSTQNSGCKIERAVATVITGNTTAREYLSGTTYILTGGSGRTLTLTGAGYGLEFGGVQSGAGALKIQALAGDVIQVGTSTSTAGGYIESGSVGATVALVGLDGTTWQAVAVSGTWTAA